MNTRHHKPVTPAKLSPDLLAVLRQWDDTDADTLAASRKRLASLSPDVSDELAAFLHRRIRVSSVSARLCALNIVLVYGILFGPIVRLGRHATLPAFVVLALAGTAGAFSCRSAFR